jgi:hypothetical protein
METEASWYERWGPFSERVGMGTTETMRMWFQAGDHYSIVVLPPCEHWTDASA